MGRSFSGSSGKNVTPPTALNASVLGRFDRSAALNCAVKGEVIKSASLDAFTALFNTVTLSAALNASVILPSTLLNGLVSYWKLDGNSTDILGSNNGSDTAITYSALNGRINSGAGFNGSSSFINLGTSASLNLPGAMSFFAWVKVANTSNFYMILTRGIWSGGGGGGATYEFRYEISTGELVFLTGGAISTGFAPVLGQWHLVGFTRSAANAVLVYVDGVQVGSGTGAGTNLPASNTFLGKRSDGFFLSGQIDDAGFWNRVLTPTEIAELYSSGAGNQYSFTGRPPDSWAFAGSLSGVKNSFGNAIRLTNNKVLVAGGHNGTTHVATAELFDSSSETWAATGSRVVPAWGPADVLLPSGKVLSAGGYNNTSQYLATCELYDPVAGTWASTGAMSVARYVARIILLPNGKALIVGGEGTITAVTELYTPSSGTWANTGSMGSARVHATIDLLSNGKVLVSGGTNAALTFLSSAELYDPSLGTWSSTGTLATARARSMSVVLQSGKVLVAGGHTTGNTMVLTAELYDPDLGTWSSAGSISKGRDHAQLILLQSGKVLLIGGRQTVAGSYTDVVEVYDPALNSWSVLNPLSILRGFSGGALLPSGKVLMAAGWNGIAAQATSELYTPSLVGASSLLSGLSAYWKLDGNSTDVLGGHNGSDTGITYSAANGKMVQGAGFASGSAINFTAIPLGTNFTTACWVNFTSGGVTHGLVTDAAQGAQLGVWGVYILTTGAVSFYDNVLHSSTGLLNTGVWHHVVVTHDGTTIRFYLNGALDPSSYAVASTFAPSKLGNDTFNQFVRGAMDEVGIWNRALSLAEIQQLYRLGIGLPYPF